MEEEEEGNDWLFTVIADIITAHNDMVELPRQVALRPFLRLLPQQQSTAYPREITTANCIIPQFRKYVYYIPPYPWVVLVLVWSNSGSFGGVWCGSCSKVGSS